MKWRLFGVVALIVAAAFWAALYATALLAGHDERRYLSPEHRRLLDRIV